MTATATTWRSRIIGSGEENPDQLLANPRNWRVHPKAQQDALAGVLDEVGWVQQVIVNQRTGHLIDGHLRVTLANRRGEASIPVLYVDLDEGEEALALATLDPLAAMATTDAAKLDELLRDVSTGEEAVQAMLAELAANAGLYADEAKTDDPGAQVDRAEELREKWQTERGQLWQVGRHRLLCGDSTNADDVARLMDGERASLCVTSPPYNQNLDTFKPSGMQRENPAFVNRMAGAYYDSIPEDEYQSQQIRMIELIASHMTANGSIFYNHKIRYRDKHIVSPMEWLRSLPFAIRQEIIWNRSSSITLNARMFMPADERIYWIRVGDDFTFNDTPDVKAWSTVWDVAAVNDVSVSAPFATEIPIRCILAASNPGEVVIEPYSGSGTTLVAAEQTGRVCYGMEIEPKYVAVALERLAGMGLDARRLD